MSRTTTTPQRRLINILLVIVVLALLFHLAVLARLIPYQIVWAGRIGTDREMYVFESISLVVNAVFGLLLLMKAGYVPVKPNGKWVNAALWAFFVLFLANTLGNLTARTTLEKLFSLFTLGNAVLIYTVLKSDRQSTRR